MVISNSIVTRQQFFTIFISSKRVKKKHYCKTRKVRKCSVPPSPLFSDPYKWQARDDNTRFNFYTCVYKWCLFFFYHVRTSFLLYVRIAGTHFLDVASRFFFRHVLGRYATPSSNGWLDMTRWTRRGRRRVKLVRFPVLAVAPLLLFLSKKKTKI